MKTLGRLLFVAAILTVASVASAQVCGDCVAGVCVQSPDPRCDHGCCNTPLGTLCTPTTLTKICSGLSPAPFYFTSRMPQQTEGSKVRLLYAPAVKAPPVKCAAAA
jgi:hypothetical protein